MPQSVRNTTHPADLYTIGEEIANSVTHGIGTLISLGATILLVSIALKQHSDVALTSATIYGASLVVLFLISTLYHSLQARRVKSIFQILDHCSIYLLIAGTYTPFLLISLNSALGDTLLVIIWVLAAAGILFRLVFGEKYPRFALFTYIAMGWLIVIAAGEMWASVPSGGLALLTAGGLLYTGGAVFYAIDRIPYNHAIWHLFVLAAATTHFLSIYLYVMPAPGTA